jgi:anti-sigma factor RsiW
MTTWNDEELMAHADGEIAGERSAALEQALAHDDRLLERVDALKAQRQRVAAAFADVLDEPVPDRLSALLASSSAGVPPPQVVELAARRRQSDERRGMSSWTAWGGMAASLVLGVVLGVQLLGPSGADDVLASDARGRLVAGQRLARGLDTQPAGQAAGGITVQLSFVDKSGQYCRTFSAGDTGGLACRQEDRWTVLATASVEQAPLPEIRQASSSLPRGILEAVDARIDGSALTAEQERQARERGWRR